ncbi:MAG TPA: DUF4139 domain-containing protein [Fimbriimonadaceae bacterium]|nr:DUF4139 domain-containing protein [Fimbriimonadaceae bacterium]HRJ95548.1 DUF4139 domain-containing protein [Fimbriimonadaceae bacterium]
MERRTAACSLLIASLLTQGCGKAEVAHGDTLASGGPRRDVEIVIYTGDFAMVNETREVELAEGRSRVGIQGVSKLLDHDSVMYSWPKTKDAKVVSSTYDLGMNQSTRLLKRYLGKEVDLVYRSDAGKESERKRGVLEITDEGYENPHVVVRVGDTYVVNPDATIEAPVTGDIVTIPQLSADVESPRAQQALIAVSYLTSGLSWNADYSATLKPESESMGLECWATVTNRTGIDFEDASISFVAGSPNRAVRPAMEQADALFAKAEDRSGSMAMNNRFEEPQRVGELYAFPYKAKASIKQDQQNRVRMMGSDSVSVKRDYAIRLPQLYDGGYYGNPSQRLPATLSLQFVNTPEAGLGQPLPGGTLRVYEPSPSGAPRYIGAATLSDTPKDAKIDATLTNVFDVFALAKVVESRRIDRRQHSTTVEITIQNEKSGATQVRLLQPIVGTWRIAGEMPPYSKLNAGLVEWTITVPAGETSKLRFTVVTGSR